MDKPQPAAQPHPPAGVEHPCSPQTPPAGANTSVYSHGDPKRTVRIYISIFVALAFLTFLTVWVNSMHVSRHLAITIAAAIALIKVVLIAAFFMHLKTEGKWIFGVVALCLAAILIFIVLISPDIAAIGGVRH